MGSIKAELEPVALTLAELNEFIQSFSDDWYFEGLEDSLSDDFWAGKFKPDEIIILRPWALSICWQGSSEHPPDDECKDCLSEYLLWKEAQTTELITIRVPKAQVKAVREALKQQFGL